MFRQVLVAGPWRAQLGLSTAGAVLGVLGLTVDGAVLAPQLGCLLVGSAVGLALDDPAADVTDVCAVSLRQRAAARVLGVMMVAGTVAVLWAAFGSTALLSLQLLGSAVVGAALAAAGRRRLHEPGELVTPAVLLGGLALIFIDGLRAQLPLFAFAAVPGRTFPLWWAVIGTSVGVIAVATRAQRWPGVPRTGRAGRGRLG